MREDDGADLTRFLADHLAENLIVQLTEEVTDGGGDLLVAGRRSENEGHAIRRKPFAAEIERKAISEPVRGGAQRASAHLLRINVQDVSPSQTGRLGRHCQRDERWERCELCDRCDPCCKWMDSSPGSLGSRMKSSSLG